MTGLLVLGKAMGVTSCAWGAEVARQAERLIANLLDLPRPEGGHRGAP